MHFQLNSKIKLNSASILKADKINKNASEQSL